LAVQADNSNAVLDEGTYLSIYSRYKSIVGYLDILHRHQAKDYHSCYDYYDRGINKTGSYYITTKASANSTEYGILEKVECDFEVLPFMTCWDHFKAGVRESGEYKAYLGGRTVNITCDFTSQTNGTNDEGSTLFPHDSSGAPTEVSQCSGSDCFNLNLTYDATTRVIEEVKKRSVSCSQTIQFDCFLTPLNPVASWTDVHGQKQTFFSGNNGTRVCDCGLGEDAVLEANKPNGEETTSCYAGPYTSTKPTCNCDARDPVFRQDIGKITNKDLLPIKSFNYGFMTSSYQKANITIGPLVCSGPCMCNVDGSKKSYCDRDNKCQCKPRFVGERCQECGPLFMGDRCQECKPGYFGNECQHQIRLRDRNQRGDSSYYGYVQIKKQSSNEWKSVYNNFDSTRANRVCQALGFPRGYSNYYSRSQCSNWSPCYYNNYPIKIDCYSNDHDLKDCDMTTYQDSSYGYFAEVRCRQ